MSQTASGSTLLSWSNSANGELGASSSIMNLIESVEGRSMVSTLNIGFGDTIEEFIGDDLKTVKFNDITCNESAKFFEELYSADDPSSVLKCVTKLKCLRNSRNRRDWELLACILSTLYTDYAYFDNYPEKELTITGRFFGAIIFEGAATNSLICGMLDQIARALSSDPLSKLWTFGVVALNECRFKLHSYPKFCSAVHSLSTFQRIPEAIRNFVVAGLSERVPIGYDGISSPVWHQPSLVAPSLPDCVSTISDHSDVNCSVTRTASSVSIASGEVIESTAKAEDPGLMRISMNEAAERVAFMFNNLTKTNVSDKAKEVKKLIIVLGDEFRSWLAHYLVLKRVSVEQNFQQLYSSLLEELDDSPLNTAVKAQTFKYIKTLLGSDKKHPSSSFGDRRLLKNLGLWLGSITVAKDRPIFLSELDIKSLLLDAYRKGQQDLLFVVPFVTKVVSSSSFSGAFGVRSAWIGGILRILAELYQLPDLKLNLKFEIDVLFKELDVDLNAMKVRGVLKDIGPLGDSEKQLTEVDNSEEGLTSSATLTSSKTEGEESDATTVEGSLSSTSLPPVKVPSDLDVNFEQAKLKRSNTDVSLQVGNCGARRATGVQSQVRLREVNAVQFEELITQVKIPATSLLQEGHPHLTRLVGAGICCAIKEILPVVTNKSVGMGVHVATCVCRKDFALNPSSEQLLMACQQMAGALAASLSLSLCIDSLVSSLAGTLKYALSAYFAGKFSADDQQKLVEESVVALMRVNVDLGVQFIAKLVSEMAACEVEKKLENEFVLRRQARALGRQFADPIAFLRSQGLPEKIRLASGAVTDQQMAVYDEFDTSKKFVFDRERFTEDGEFHLGEYFLGNGQNAAAWKHNFSSVWQNNAFQANVPPIGPPNGANLWPSASMVWQSSSRSSTVRSASPERHNGWPIALNPSTVSQSSYPTLQSASTQASSHQMPPPVFAEMDHLVSMLCLLIRDVDTMLGSRIWPPVRSLRACAVIRDELVALKSSPRENIYVQKFLRKLVEQFLYGYTNYERLQGQQAAPMGQSEVECNKALKEVFLVACKLMLYNASIDELRVFVTRCVNESARELLSNVDALQLLSRYSLLEPGAFERYLSASVSAAGDSDVVTLAQRLVVHSGNENNHILPERWVSTLDQLVRLRQKEERRAASSAFESAPYGMMPKVMGTGNGVAERSQVATGMGRPVEDGRGDGKLSTHDDGLQPRPTPTDTELSLTDATSVAERPSDDPVAQRDAHIKLKAEAILRDWIQVCYTHDAQKSPQKALAGILRKMNEVGVLSTDELITKFFRFCTEVCVDVSYRLLATDVPQRQLVMFRQRCYYTLDAFAKLVCLMVKFSDGSQCETKINLLKKVLNILANVLHSDHELRGTEFEALPYERLLITMFKELATDDAEVAPVSWNILEAFGQAMFVMQPRRVPSFAFAWLDIIGHRDFIARHLGPSVHIEKTMPMYAQLLLCHLKFLAPFLRNMEMSKSIYALYRGTMKIMLVIVHDYPQLLCEYHSVICDSLPTNCIQLRNVVLSAYPPEVKLPNPFSFKFDSPKSVCMRREPKIRASVVGIISEELKAQFDEYFKTRSPTDFLQNLVALLQCRKETGGMQPESKYCGTLLSGIVMYVGMCGIEALNEKGETVLLASIWHTQHADFFVHFCAILCSEGRYLLFNALVNQIRYPNTHTKYFGSILLYIFLETSEETVREQITRALFERLVALRPHPWGILVVFIELLKNPIYDFWNHSFVHCAPEVERLLQSVSNSWSEVQRSLHSNTKLAVWNADKGARCSTAPL